jgi:hypothetical protein
VSPFHDLVDDPVLTCASWDRSNLIQVRTYDCSITYDKYYQTPRMWLQGYDEVIGNLVRVDESLTPGIVAKTSPPTNDCPL